MESFRRGFINSSIFKYENKLNGLVADFGGTKKNSRSKINNNANIDKIISINIDKNSGADIIADLEGLPFESNYFDSFLLLEVLEHVKNPNKVLKEINRVLKKDSTGLISMPFLYQIHEAPTDFRRWTRNQLINFFEKENFEIISIEENGGIFAVIFDLLRSFLLKLDNRNLLNKFFIKILKLFKPLFKFIDKKTIHLSKSITTGYFLVLRKK